MNSEALIEPGVTLGADCNLAPFAVLKSGTVLGDRVTVDHFAVVGGLPQDLKFDPATKSGVRIGAGSIVINHIPAGRRAFGVPAKPFMKQ